MVTCPVCNGRKSQTGLVCIRRNDGPGTAEIRTDACRTCKGAGEISEAKAAALIEGERRRLDRIARGLSLNEESARLGITPIELNRIEFAKDVA